MEFLTTCLMLFCFIPMSISQQNNAKINKITDANMYDCICVNIYWLNA